MQRIVTIAAVILASWSAAPAQSRPIPYPIFETRAWERAVEAGIRTRSGEPGLAAWKDDCSYDIVAELDPVTARVTGVATLRYTNPSSRPLRQILIHLRQNLHRENAVRNTSVEITGGMEVGEVRVEGKALGGRRVRTRGTVMTVDLPRRLAPKASVTLEIDWSFKVPEAGRAPRMGHEDHHVFYLAYWYPQFAVLDDVEGWVADPYLGQGEFYMPYGDYRLAMTVPVGWLVRATGALTNPEDVLRPEQRGRLEQAAQGRDVVHVITPEDLEAGRMTREGEGKTLTWKFVATRVRDIAVSISDRYLWDATSARVKDRDGPGKDGTCMIHAVYEPDTRGWKTKAAEYGRHTIEFMSAEVYPYPWPQMTICEGIVGGGMEFPMMTNIGVPGMPQVLHGTIAHELIHMWFPMIVGTDEKSWAWMDEGLTSFFTTLAADDYWESDRSTRQAFLQYRSSVRRGSDSVCMTHADHFAPRSGAGMGFASYAKPSAVLHQLRALVGKERFMKAMRTYAASWAFAHPYPYDFFNTFNTVVGEDLDWYFRTWLYEAWPLDQAVTDVALTGDHSMVTITDLGLAPAPTEVRVTYTSGEQETRTIPVTHWLQGERIATLKFGPGVRKVELDPDGTTLDIDPANNTWTAR